jgi:hypothetical protein
MGMDLSNGFSGWLAGLIIFWTGIVKVFNVDLFGGIIIVAVRMLISFLVDFALAGMAAASA